MGIYNILKEKRRLELDLKKIGLPEIPLIGVNILTSATGKLPLHVHKGTLEIVYMVRGKQVFSTGTKQYTLKSNDVFITEPDILHGSGGHLMDRAFFYWLQITLPSEKKSILCLNNESSMMLSNKLRNIKTNRFAGNKNISSCFEEIFELYHKRGKTSKLAISSQLVQLLLNVIDCASNPKNSFITEDISASLELLDDNPHTFLTVEQMAHAANLSCSRFKCKFKQQTGLPPAEYQLRKKIEMAKEMLKSSDLSITEIAYKLGFSSSQYFATRIQKIHAENPGQCFR